MKILFAFRIEQDNLNKLKKLAKEKNRTSGYLIRDAIKKYLKAHGKIQR